MAAPQKWLQSADVLIDDVTGAVCVKKVSPKSFASGTKSVAAAATPERLAAVSMPGCAAIWFAAPVDSSGNPVNTKPVFIGDADCQNVPVMPTNFEGFTMDFDDPYDVYVKVGVNAESVVYRVFV
jgi:hypothetical protein